MEKFLKKYWWAVALVVFLFFFNGMSVVTGLIGGVTGASVATKK